MTTHFAFSSYRHSKIFSLIARNLIFRVLSLSLCSIISFVNGLVCVPKTTLYKSSSMLSKDGSLLLKFQSRQKFIFKGSFHLPKTRHLVRNSGGNKIIFRFKLGRTRLAEVSLWDSFNYPIRP